MREPFEETAKLIRLRSYCEDFYAMIGAYMDESFDRPNQPGDFVVGGFLGRGVQVFELERRWETLRKRSDIDIAYFKAVECERGTGEFAKFVVDPQNKTDQEMRKLKSIHSEFLNLIKTPVAHDSKAYFTVFGVSIVQDDFYKLTRNDPKAKAILGDNPHRLSYSLAMIQCAWAMRNLNTGDRVSYVCDEHEQYSPLAAAEYPLLKATNPDASKHMATFSYSDEKSCEPLQAADLIVYELRRAINVQLKHRTGDFRDAFNELRDKDMLFLIQHATKENLQRIVDNNLPGQPFNMDELMQQEYPEDIRF